jgi:hypothetical protein
MKANQALPLFLQAMVPLLIAELTEAGGATDADLARVRGYVDDFNVDGDALLFRRKGKTGEMAGKLADALAVLAFQPGGVEFAGLHFEAQGEKRCCAT